MNMCASMYVVYLLVVVISDQRSPPRVLSINARQLTVRLCVFVV